MRCAPLARSAPLSTDDPLVATLRSQHVELRRHSLDALTLAERVASGEPVTRVRREARRLLDVVPALHAEHEAREHQLVPWVAGSSPEVDEALDLLARQRGLVTAVLDEAREHWRRLALSSAQLDAKALVHAMRRLDLTIELHVALEEARVFSALPPLGGAAAWDEAWADVPSA
jgi:hypothetical protein